MFRHQQLITTVATACLCLLVTASPQSEDKWSRQLESTGPGQADSFDWVPLAQPVDGSDTKDRSANGRVLTYSQAFPPDGRFGNIPKSHNAPPLSQQQGFDFPYQFQRFSNVPQPQTLRQQQSLKASSLHTQEPTSQSFFKFEMPFHSDHGHRSASAPSSLQTGYQIQHTFGGGAQATLFNSPLYSQNPVFPPEFHPVPPKPQQQPLQQQKPLHQQNFIEDTFPLKNSFRESSKPVQHDLESLQAVTPQVFPADPQAESIFELRKPSSFQANSPFHQTAPSASPAPSLSSAPSSQNNPSGQPEDVQLLYVPYETLYNQQQRPTVPPSSQSSGFEVNKFNVNPGLPAVNPYQINQFYTQDPFGPEPNFYTSTTTHRPSFTSTTTTNKPAFQSFNNQQYTTQKPKPKAHQPPLAMFLLRNTARPTQSDVVAILRNANTIAVLDAPTKQTPDIFVGPSGMPIPSGYVKFDLPYLSQLSQPRDLREVSFFVAPLSYRTPNGFNKILLPEPHVGSIVINRARDNFKEPQQQQKAQHPQQPQQQNTVYITPNQNEYIQNSYQTSTPRTRPSTYRPKPQQVSSSKDYFPDVLREPSQHQKNRNPFETTTQRVNALQPSRGNKFSYFYDQDAIQEVTSPKITKHDRPKKKRPQVVQVDQPVYPQKINNPYAQFQPMPNQIAFDDYYKTETTRPTSPSTSTSTTSTTTTTTSTTPAPTFYQFTTNPQLEYQSTNGQFYSDFTTGPREPEEYAPRFTTRPPTATTAEEEYRMKQYFRQQTAFRHRPQIVSSTNPPFEYVNYTPAVPEYEQPAAPTQRPTMHKQRVTYYTPTALPTAVIEEEPLQTLPPRPEYNRVEAQTDIPADGNLPNNHRPSYNQNEILDGTVEYEPNPYQLPSELPPLTANLPGLVNGLQDKAKQQGIEETSAATPTYTQEQSTTPSTRRPNRTRKPVIAKVSSSVSYSESESPSKRPSHRIRRPYGSRSSPTPSVATASYEDDSHSSTTTRRPQSSRTAVIRNPNRVRYQPTPEERQTLRLKPRKKYTGSNKVKESEDLDYQRDVLKQNYPVFRPAGSARRPTSPTASLSDTRVETTTDRYTSESQQIYTVTPSNNIDSTNDQNFPAGLLEPMQIAQQYNHYSKDNYGPGYFPNQEDLIPTESIGRNEIHPVYTTTPSTTTSTTVTTTTTEKPVVTSTTRRSPFIRRNYPRLRPTTTEAPTPTTAAPDERHSARPRVPPRKVIKVRARTRRPTYQASTTSAPDEYFEQQEDVDSKNNYRKLNRFNQDLYENDTPRRRYKQQFHLDGQESQWSPSAKATNKNTFTPVDPEDDPKENTHNFDDEPEIVTADTEHDHANEKSASTYEIKVSANLSSHNTATNKPSMNKPNLKPEKSFAELLEEVMGKAPEETTTESELALRTTESTFFESQKTAISNRINRRGKWKKVRTSPTRGSNGESFETAESQNLGPQLLNSLYASDKTETKLADQQQLKTTTPATPTTTAVRELTTMSAATMTTTPTPQTTIDDYDMTTARILDSTTMPTTTLPMNVIDEAKQTTTSVSETTQETTTHQNNEYDLANEDDLETQPSLFSEVKRQLHELFSIEESEDQALDGAIAAVGRRRQEYTNIQRPKPELSTEAPQTTEAPLKAESNNKTDTKDPFHKNLMEHVVYATATSTKVSSETEICYRGRCIRSEDLPPNHKLN